MSVEMTPWEKDCYGTSEANIIDQVKRMRDSLMQKPAMTAMSILSDAQQELEMGNAEASRLKMNIAKFIISRYWMNA